MRPLALVIALSSFIAFAEEQNAQGRTIGVVGTPVIYTFTDVTCQELGDHLQTVLEPDGRFFKPFTIVNGNPTLTFTLAGGYKSIYTFGGTMTHVALRPDICRVEINAAGATAEDATKTNKSSLVEMLGFMLCRAAKATYGASAEPLRSTIIAQSCKTP